MLTTSLIIRGNEHFKVRSAARRFGLGRDSYVMKGELRTVGPNKGTPLPCSTLRINLSTKLDIAKHMAEVEAKLDQILSLIALEQKRHTCILEVYLATGLTVGHKKKYYTRTTTLSPTLMAKLAALDIHYQISSYPSY